MDKPEIKDFRFVMHMNMGNCGIRTDIGTIVWEGNPIDGKTLVREVYTPKTKMQGWGKGEVSLYLQEKNSPTFKTIGDFIAHYKVPEQPKEEPALPRVKVKPEALEKRMKELKKKKR